MTPSHRFIIRLSVVAVLCSAPLLAQSAPAPAIVQPGAPGTANVKLTPEKASAGETPRAPSIADIKFMQGMIMHHGQAVEMTALIASHTKDPDVVSIGGKIKLSQTDEMRWMKQWLTDRGLPLEDESMGGMKMDGMDMSKMDMSKMDHSKMDHSHMNMDHGGMDMDMPPMPGMLTKAQMEALRKAHGAEFDHLFLTGMMQHHTGALTMVKDLFAQPGAGQDPQLFDFANDVDNTQQAEIDIMRHMLQTKEKK